MKVLKFITIFIVGSLLFFFSCDKKEAQANSLQRDFGVYGFLRDPFIDSMRAFLGKPEMKESYYGLCVEINVRDRNARFVYSFSPRDGYIQLPLEKLSDTTGKITNQDGKSIFYRKFMQFGHPSIAIGYDLRDFATEKDLRNYDKVGEVFSSARLLNFPILESCWDEMQASIRFKEEEERYANDPANPDYRPAK